MANKTLKKNDKKKSSINKNAKNVFNSWQPVATFGFAILIFCLVIVPGENLWFWLHNFIFSLFGVCSILWPILIGTVAVLDAMGKSVSNLKLKLWLSVATIIFACSLFYVFSFFLTDIKNVCFFVEIWHFYDIFHTIILYTVM